MESSLLGCIGRRSCGRPSTSSPTFPNVPAHARWPWAVQHGRRYARGDCTPCISSCSRPEHRRQCRQLHASPGAARPLQSANPAVLGTAAAFGRSPRHSSGSACITTTTTTTAAAAPGGDSGGSPARGDESASALPPASPSSSSSPASPSPSSSSSAPSEPPAAEAASPASLAPRTVSARQYATAALRLLRRHLWALVLVHSAADLLTFLLHRLSHRATNFLALLLLGHPSVSPAGLGNPWWLCTNPEVANFATGYQPLSLALFVLAFPLELVLRSVAMAYTGALLTSSPSQSSSPGSTQREGKAPAAGRLSAVRGAWRAVRGAQASVPGMWRRVLQVDVRVALQVVPLQLLSWPLVTLPWTLPRILQLQLAQPAAVVEGASGNEALARSRELAKPSQWGYAWPFVGSLVLLKVLDPLRSWLFQQMPMRWYRELPEIPLLLVAFFPIASLLLSRLRDVLPYAAYFSIMGNEAALGNSNSGAAGSVANDAQRQQQQLPPGVVQSKGWEPAPEEIAQDVKKQQ